MGTLRFAHPTHYRLGFEGDIMLGMHTRVLLLLIFGLAWPATAFAHMGHWQITLPLASLALGITLGLLSLFLRPSARFYVAIGVAAAMVALALIYILASDQSITAGDIGWALLIPLSLTVAPFLSGFALPLLTVSAIRVLIASWRRVCELLRSGGRRRKG